MHEFKFVSLSSYGVIKDQDKKLMKADKNN